jgi:tetratricopeptide (TPR) repeat protein
MKTITRFFIFCLFLLATNFTYGQNIDADIRQAIDYYKQGKYTESGKIFEQWLPIVRDSLGENDTSLYINLLCWTGACFYQANELEKAEPFMKDFSRLIKKNLGENHPNYGISLNNLAQLYETMGRYEQAEALIQESIRIAKESIGRNHRSYSTYVSNLGKLYYTMGRYVQAEPLMKEAMQLDKESLGENHPSYCRDIDNLAELYETTDRYEQAEPLMREAMQIDKESLGENHPDYATCVSNLGDLYSRMGRYEQAEPLMREAMDIRNKVLGETHPDYAISLNNLATLYIEMGRYEQAEPLMKKALQITKESLGENHSITGTYLNNLALLYEDMGKYEEAEQLMKRAIQTHKETLGENHPDYVLDINNLAILYLSLDRYEQAEAILKKALRIAKKSFGENYPNYGTILDNLALCYQEMDQYEKAEPLMEEAFGLLTKEFRGNIGYLSEKEMEQFAGKMLNDFETFQSFNIENEKSNVLIGKFAFDIELYRKGALLRSTQGVRNRILKSGDTALIIDFNRLFSIRKQIDHLYSLDSAKRYDDPAKLELQANDLEKSLAIRSKDYSQAMEELNYTWKDIQQQLKPDEAVIEFASFDFYSNRWTDTTYYCALVLRKEYEYPKMVYLFEKKQISALLPKTSASEEVISKIYSVKNEESKTKDLYKLIWGPLEPYLTGVDKVDFAVSGQLNRVAFHALTDENGNLLLNKYDLVQLSSTREVALPKPGKKLESIAIFGGIDYNADTTDMLAMAREVTTEDMPRSVYRSDSTSRNFDLRYLPGTMEEAKEVKIECQDKGMDVKFYTGKQATEEQFRQLGDKKSPSVIHIATHGFYFPEEKKKDREERMRFMQLGQQANQFVYSPDPLIRSGLMMAGANHAWKGEKLPEGVEDGILTAREVSQLNLLNTELVVLSACQTGLGDVKGSEGVYGLQRAFKMAGVRYLMMSLWKVPDETTKEFMVTFYGHLTSGITIKDSYRNTQREMSAKYPDDPFKWAGFVLLE